MTRNYSNRLTLTPFVRPLVGAITGALLLGGCAQGPTMAEAEDQAETVGKAAVSDVSPATEHQAQIGSFGFDTEGMNRSVAPGDNFYDYANGRWHEITEIPADRANYGMFTMLEELSQKRSREILEEARNIPGSRIGDLYAAFMDESRIEAQGLAPLMPMLERIDGLKDRRDVAAELGRFSRIGVRGPFGLGVETDDKLPDVVGVRLRQSGLGLPDRDYYLSDDAGLVGKKAAYQTYLQSLLTLAGESDAASRARAVVDFESKLAKAHWTRVDSRDSDKTYNKWPVSAFDRDARGFAWSDYLREAGVADQTSVIVSQPSAIKGSAAAINATPLPVLKDYLRLQLIDAFAPMLSTPFVDANFDFHGTTLNGTPENEPRWKRGVGMVGRLLSDDLSRIYVDRYFPAESKAAADALVRNVIVAMDARLAGLEWMAPETRDRARQKLAAFTPKIGYPSSWRDYSSIAIDRDDLIASVMAATAFEDARQLGKLGQPVDREEWFMTPMTVNAYANSNWNEIVFPAAILQPPFFDPHADPAINYGGIGAVIGHEISHHFDDQGRKYDKSGALTDWWTAEDVRRFDALTGQLVEQYDLYEPMPGKFVQGKLTLGENIADLAGLTVAHDAYRLSLDGKPAPVLDGVTGDQRFYLGWAQVWRRKYRDDNLLQRLLTDPHSPSEQRVAVVRNLDPWYAAFNPATGAPLYLAPEDRVRIW